MGKVRRLNEMDYYELLGVGRTATADDVKRAFHAFARKYHPDQGDGKGGRIYRRGTEAYRVLSDSHSRTLYNEGLASGQLRYDPTSLRKSLHPSMPPGFANVRTSKARPFVMKAEQALRQGDKQQARLNFQIAQKHEPDNEDIKNKLADLKAPQKSG